MLHNGGNGALDCDSKLIVIVQVLNDLLSAVSVEDHTNDTASAHLVNTLNFWEEIFSQELLLSVRGWDSTNHLRCDLICLLLHLHHRHWLRYLLRNRHYRHDLLRWNKLTPESWEC